jgi:membrane protease YdiL (CAAX protease family)
MELILTQSMPHTPPKPAIQNFSRGNSIFTAMPLSLLVVGCLLSATLEELTFRGYAICRLRGFGVSAPIAVAISVAAATISHVPFWGTGPIVIFGMGELLFALLFVWRGNLFAAIVAHILVNSYAILIWPALPHALQSAVSNAFEIL